MRGPALPLMIVAITMAIWAAFLWDDGMDHWVLTHQARTVKHWAGALSHYGDWPYLMAAGLVAAGAFKLLRRDRCVRIVLVMMAASTISGIAVNTVRLTAGRTRPNAHFPAGWYGLRHGGHWLIGNNPYNSFPSGHTATAVGFAVPLLLVAPAAGVPVLAVAVSIAGSRVYLRAHHLSDITVAALVAAWISVAMTRRFLALHPAWICSNSRFSSRI